MANAHGGRLRFDGRELLAYRSRPEGARWWWEALADDATLSSPEPVERSIKTLSRHGTRAVIDRYENRSPSFQLVACGIDAVALAEAEAALFFSCKGKVDLEWTPPNGLGATTVYPVQTSRLDHAFDDFEELGPGILRRSYRLTMNAAPFGRGVDRVVLDVPAGTATPTMTLLDAMTVATGWEVSTGSISTGSDGGGTYLRASWTTYVDEPAYMRKPGTTYTCLDWVRVTYSGTRPLTALLVDGEPVTPTRVGTATGEVWFYVGGGTHTLGFVWSLSMSGSGTGYMNFYDISTTNDTPAGLAKIVDVPGSAPGPWLVRVGSASGALGRCVAVAGPRIGLYNPVVAASGGGASLLGTGFKSLTGVPAGDYSLVILLSTAISGTVVIDGQSTVITTASKVWCLGAFSVGNGYGGRPSTWSAQITTGVSGAFGALLLIPKDDDHQSVLGDFTGQYLFIDPAELSGDDGGVFTGNQSDGADALPAWSQMLSGKPLELDPPSTAIYVYPSSASLQIAGFSWWHTHAAGVNEGVPA